MNIHIGCEFKIGKIGKIMTFQLQRKLKKLGLSVSLPRLAVRESNLGVWRKNNIPP